ncbi:DUF805 domain-containing protein [Ochrovirga pacifica]|uniref:DUF805 domain-containing protein n=1 Tax=Ochrovirga pacifica TaxID=1042376 RepID=UPI0002559B1C|nr:DUF805 domain-containing protein [Ochrovirga pacifica]
MNWYLKVLKQYADFKGRARRKEYWMFVLFNILFGWGIQLLALITGLEFLAYVSVLYSIALLIPGIAVTVRRLHDIGKPGFMIFICLIPLVGAIWLLVLVCKEGEYGSNEYGPDPKSEVDELDEIGVSEA